MNIRIFGVIGVVLGILVSNFVLKPTHEMEKAKAACVKDYPKRMTGVLFKNTNAEEYCGCLVESLVKKHNDQRVSTMSCLEIHGKPAMLETCENEIKPMLQSQAQMTLDCSCFYDEIIALMTKFFEEGATSVTSEQEQVYNEQILQNCAH